ncbi:hypothetical protein Lser_V15G44911 [Lactuca serriola]
MMVVFTLFTIILVVVILYMKSSTPGRFRHPWFGGVTIFLGYPSNHKGYQCLDLHTKKIIISHHVTFDEYIFPFESMTSDHPHHMIFLTSMIETNLSTQFIFCLLPRLPKTQPLRLWLSPLPSKLVNIFFDSIAASQLLHPSHFWLHRHWFLPTLLILPPLVLTLWLPVQDTTPQRQFKSSTFIVMFTRILLTITFKLSEILTGSKLCKIVKVLVKFKKADGSSDRYLPLCLIINENGKIDESIKMNLGIVEQVGGISISTADHYKAEDKLKRPTGRIRTRWFFEGGILLRIHYIMLF